MNYYSTYYDYSYGYDYGYDNLPSGLVGMASGVLLFMVVVAMVASLISLARYILEAVALYNLAKRRGINNPFLAFIPVANSYLLGAIHDDINKTMNKPSKNAIKLLVLKIAALVIDFISVPFIVILSFLAGATGVGVIVSVISSLITAIDLVLAIVCYVFSYISIYAIYKEYAYEHATLYLVLSIVFMPLRSVFLFIIRNKQSGYELWLKQREQQQRAAAETKFEEAVTENSVEEVFANDTSFCEEQEQTIIEQTEEQPSTMVEIELENFQQSFEQTENE